MKNLKKILILLTWIFIIAYLVISPFLISDKVSDIMCTELVVNIVNEYEGHSFITKDEILKLLDKKQIKIIDQQIDAIQETELEDILADIPFVGRADVFVSVKGIVEIDIKQRIPLFRVINDKNQNFYIDLEGQYMPVSNNYTAHVLTVRGNYQRPLNIKRNDTLNAETKKPKLYEIVKFITNDDLWNAQIEQIYINSKDELELVPRVGGQRILFGTSENYERKFLKLYALYEQGFKKFGWNNYKTINLSYKNQVVCTKI